MSMLTLRRRAKGRTLSQKHQGDGVVDGADANMLLRRSLGRRICLTSRACGRQLALGVRKTRQMTSCVSASACVHLCSRLFKPMCCRCRREGKTGKLGSQAPRPSG